MAVTECGRGHIYDSDQYSVCPYCNSRGNVINFSSFDVPGRAVTPGYGIHGGAAAPGSDVPGATAAPGYGASGPAVNAGPRYDVPGRTVAPESYRKKQEHELRTVGVLQKKYKVDPVAGWLVCIEGAERGRSYELFARINTIGRGEENDVCISGDMTVSKEHARLAYEPRYDGYQLIPGQATNSIYVNYTAVYVPTKLSSYDVIELGETKLLFIPLCGERFHWDDKEKRG